jgi:hypothetical protein
MKSSNAEDPNEVYALRTQDDQRQPTDDADAPTRNLYPPVRPDFAPAERLNLADVVTSMPWKLVTILVAVVVVIFAGAAAYTYAAYRYRLGRVPELRQQIESAKQRLQRLPPVNAPGDSPLMREARRRLRHRIDCLEYDKNFMIAQNEDYQKQKKSLHTGLVTAVLVLVVLLAVRVGFHWSWRARTPEPD